MLEPLCFPSPKTVPTALVPVRRACAWCGVQASPPPPGPSGAVHDFLFSEPSRKVLRSFSAWDARLRSFRRVPGSRLGIPRTLTIKHPPTPLSVCSPPARPSRLGLGPSVSGPRPPLSRLHCFEGGGGAAQSCSGVRRRPKRSGKGVWGGHQLGQPSAHPNPCCCLQSPLYSRGAWTGTLTLVSFTRLFPMGLPPRECRMWASS